MRKAVRGLIAACIIAIVLMSAGYVALSMYYKDGFTLNTWINGVYCTGFSVEEINAQLLEQTEIPKTLTIVGYNSTGKDCEEVSWTLSRDDLQYSIDYTSNLNIFKGSQNPWMWPDNFASSQNHIVNPNITIDELMLLEEVEKIVVSSTAPEDYRIEYSEELGYVLYDGMHNRVDEQKVHDAVRDAIVSGEESLNLIEYGCYYDLTLNEEQEAQKELWDKINNYQSNGPVYDFGAGEEQITKADMATFLQKDTMTNMPFLDENAYFIIEDGSAQNWVASTAEKHDTYGKIWDFKSTRGEELQIEGKTYGSTINQKQEVIWLETYLQTLVTGQGVAGVPADEGKTGKPHIPEYTRTSYNGAVGLGDTYVEVDMGIQKMYYYENGELMLETDVVTGNARRRWNTPEGVNYVYSKQKNRILRGEGYASPVDYWMPVNGAIGIHDADWRDEFGGEIYKTDGSHGCVNVPKEVMPDFYEMVELGTPVVMFYGTDPYTDVKE